MQVTHALRDSPWPAIVLVGLSGIANAILTFHWLKIDSDGTGSSAVVSGSVFVVNVLVLSYSVPTAVVRRRQRRTRNKPLMESVPRSVSTAVAVIPFVSSLSGSGLSVGLAGLGLTLGDTALLSTDYRRPFIGLIVVSLVAASATPWVALTYFRQELDGRRVPLFDSMAPIKSLEASASEAWNELLGQKRYWARRVRKNALGRLCSPPLVAWPSQWSLPTVGARLCSPKCLFGVQGVAVVVCASLFAVCLLAAKIDPAAGWIPLTTVIALVALSGLLPMAAASVAAYVQTLGEQNRADVIRMAVTELKQRRERETSEDRERRAAENQRREEAESAARRQQDELVAAVIAAISVPPRRGRRIRRLAAIFDE